MYSTEVIVASRAARAAGTVIQAFEQENKKLNIGFKGKNDLVTDADLAAEKEIITTIKETFPGDQFLAEESHSSQVLTDARTWIIDPIDGTTNFSHGYPAFCVSIALWENKAAKVGVILDVSRDELFVAEEGGGAFVNDIPIQVSSLEEPQNALILTSFPSPRVGFINEYMDLFCNLMEETQGPRRPGSAAYDQICLASGRCDGYYVYGLSPWDLAAGGLIIREAGGIVTDWTGGDNWLFGQRLIAGNNIIHQFLKNKLHEFIPGEYLTS